MGICCRWRLVWAGVWLVLGASWIGCSGLDIGVFTQIQAKSTLAVTLDPNNPNMAAGLQANISVAILPGRFGNGVVEWRGAVIEYCVPRGNKAVTGDTIARSECVRENGRLLQLSVPSIRFPKDFELACAGSDVSRCTFPGGTSPLQMEIFSAEGHLSPNTSDWKATTDSEVIETIDGKPVTTTLKRGPCNHLKFIELYIYIGFRGDEDTAYAFRVNGDETNFFSQDRADAPFKLTCSP